MQNGASVAARFSGTPEKTAPVPPIPAAPLADEIKAALPALPTDVSVPDLGTSGKVIHSRRLAAIDAGFQAPTLSDAQTPTPFELACKPLLLASPAPGAMVDIELSAPCDSNARITVRHGALSFTDVTDVSGNFAVSIPALQEAAKVTVSFDYGRTIEASAHVSTLDGYSRSAIVWRGQTGLHIHALEFGAGYGDAGDVWAEAARTPDHGVRALGGFLTLLGNADVLNPELAEVYSFPADRMARRGVVRMIVEADVAGTICGQAIDGYTIELGVDGAMRDVALQLVMPDCDATGGYLVLKNLLQDMKIAQN
ncbi:MAG: hypothetical protein WBN04_18010 [Paracoccaceae bacterium]